MKIAIIAGESFYKTSSLYIATLLAQNAGNEVYIFNKTQRDARIPGTINIAVRPALSGLLPGSLMLQKAIAGLIKKHMPDRIWVFDAEDVIKTPLHQTLILNNDHPVEKQVLSKLEAAQRIIVFSKTHLQKLAHLHLPLQEKLMAAPPVIAATFGPQLYEDRLGAKQEFADEKEYFAFADFEVDKESFLNLLKAFSAFKKMQQTNWKLVVALRPQLSTKDKEEMLTPLSNFKYRQDVNVINGPGETTLSKMIAGAYALISTTDKTIYNLPVLEALACSTPAVALRSEIFNDYPQIILEATNSSPDSFAEKMMFLYKNEMKRTLLSESAGGMLKDFDAEKNLTALHQIILE